MRKSFWKFGTLFSKQLSTNSSTKPSARNFLLLGSFVGFSSGALACKLYYDKKNKSVVHHNENLQSICRLSDISSPVYGNKNDFDTAIKQIEEFLGVDNVDFKETSIKDHADSYWNTHHPEPEQKPICVVYPHSTEDVSKIMKVCYKYRIPVIPFCGGTSLEGHFISTRNGICIDLSNMNQILKLNENDFDVVVQPGLSWEDLNDQLAEKNLIFGCDPGPTAQIGGMIATSCSGTNAYKFGTMKENVINLTVVLADGTIVKTKKRSRKTSAGYSLNQLFIGSEGTLGIVTEATLKVHVKPLRESIVVIGFDSVANAGKSVQDFIKNDIDLGAVELMDDKMMKCINDSNQLSLKWPEKPTLFLKVHPKDENETKNVIEKLKNISKVHKSCDFKYSSNEEDNFELWNARKIALWSTIEYGKKTNPNIKLWTTDVAVPISKLSDALELTGQIIANTNFMTTLVGHVGDGNFHYFLLYDEKEYKDAKRLVDKIIDKALELEGTCTGEHGVGIGKRDFLEQEVGEDAVAVMRKVKMALDPLRLLNPDKVFKVDPLDSFH